MTTIKVLENLLEKRDMEKAQVLFKELKKKYNHSPSLSKILKKIESNNSYLKSENIIHKNLLSVYGDQFGDYKNLNGSIVRIILQSLITKFDGEKCSFSTDLKNSIRIYEGRILIPFQSVIKSRYHLIFKKLPSNIKINYAYSSSHTSLPNKNSVLNELKVNDKSCIFDVDPHRGQCWLVIEKKGSNEFEEIIFERIRAKKIKNPSVLVIIPYHNDDLYIEDALESMLLQTYEGKIIVVIVDDFSKSDSSEKLKEIIKKYQSKLNINYIKHEYNKRLSESRNTAINKFKADFVQLLDSDDALHPECISLKVESFYNDNHPLTIGSVSKIKLINERQNLKQCFKEKISQDFNRITLLSAFGRCPTNCHGPLVSYIHLKGVGGFAPSINKGAEDYDIWLRLLNLGFEFANVNFVLGYYRMKSENSMAKLDVSGHFLESSRIIYQTFNQSQIDYMGIDFKSWPYRNSDGLKNIIYLRQIFERWLRLIIFESFNSKTSGYVNEERLNQHLFTQLNVSYHFLVDPPNNMDSVFTFIPNIIEANLKRCLGKEGGFDIKKVNADLKLKIIHEVTKNIYDNLNKKTLDNIKTFKKEKINTYDFPSYEDNKNPDCEEINFYFNRYKGKRCFILGNGPSLNKHDLTLLENEYSFGVNGIFYKTQENGFVPSFYVVEDNAVMKENIEKIRSYRPRIKKFFPTCYSHLHPKDGKTVFFKMNLGFYRKNCPYHETPQFSKDASKRLFCGQSVTIINLQLAYYMGFTEVYLIGMDFNYVLNKDTQEVQKNKVLILSKGDDENHFHPEYFGKGKTWKDPKLYNVEKSYLCCKDAYERDNRKIINASVGGKLEVFDRISYENIFKK